MARRRSQGTAAPRRRQAQPPANKAMPDSSRGVCPAFSPSLSGAGPPYPARFPPPRTRPCPIPRAGFARLFSVPCAQASCCRPRRGTAPAPCRYGGRFPRRQAAAYPPAVPGRTGPVRRSDRSGGRRPPSFYAGSAGRRNRPARARPARFLAWVCPARFPSRARSRHAAVPGAGLPDSSRGVCPAFSPSLSGAGPPYPARFPPPRTRPCPIPRAGFARLFSVPCAQASCCRPRRGTAPAPCRYGGRFPRRHRAPTCAACSSHPGRFSIACYRTGPPPARANGWSRMRRIAPPAHISGLGGKTVQSSGKNKPPFFRNAAAGSANRGAGSRFCTPYAPAPAARRTAIPAGAQKPKPRRRPSKGGAGAGAISRRTQ